MVNGPNKRGFQGNIEAGGILSECVINIKTIFSFNFQKAALNMYLETIENVKKYFLRDAIISGFLIGVGYFCSFAAYASVFHLSKKYILKGELDSEEMASIISIVMTCTQGLTHGMRNLANLKKANNSYKSLYSILLTPSLMPPFKEDNQRKISPENMKGKIEFRNVFFLIQHERKCCGKKSFIYNNAWRACGFCWIFWKWEKYYCSINI